MSKGTIAIDADGVLLDFSLAYAHAWRRAFGVLPVERDPHAYWPIDRWGVERLTGERLAQFRQVFDEEFWSTVPAIQGALDACNLLVDQGYDLVCVSAVDSRYEAARLKNLQRLGLPVSDLIATGDAAGDISPKAEALNRTMPVAFVDDYLPYHRGVSGSIHKALVLRARNGSPNVGQELSLVDSLHPTLLDFARVWPELSGRR